jgi:hypothetical protein
MNTITFTHDEGSTAKTVTPSKRRLVVDHNCIVYERVDDLDTGYLGDKGPWREIHDAGDDYHAAIEYMKQAH